MKAKRDYSDIKTARYLKEEGQSQVAMLGSVRALVCTLATKWIEGCKKFIIEERK